jgi:hypothetical protein
VAVSYSRRLPRPSRSSAASSTAPITDEELAELAAREGMPVSAVMRLPRCEFHDETEYIVDGSALNAVEIVRRYSSP